MTTTGHEHLKKRRRVADAVGRSLFARWPWFWMMALSLPIGRLSASPKLVTLRPQP